MEYEITDQPQPGYRPERCYTDGEPPKQVAELVPEETQPS